MHTLLLDLKYSIRTLAKQPLVSAVMIILVVLGIGANTSIFSFVNATLLRPIQGVRDPASLVSVYTSDYSSGLYGTSSYPDYLDFRDQGDSFVGLAAHSRQRLLARVGDDFEPLSGHGVSGNFFTVLGITPTLGRLLTTSDNLPGANLQVAVISHGYWQRRFGGTADVVGTTLILNNQPYTIVGVSSADFSGVTVDSRPDVWIPIANRGAEILDRRSSRWLRIVGRLSPEATVERAGVQMIAIMARLAEQYPGSNKGTLQAPDRPRPVTVTSAARLGPQMRDQIELVAWLLMAVAGMVLLIACVNMANLLLARASVRRQEIAVRLSLGATRSRLVRQLVTESMLIAFIGGGVALLITDWIGNLIPGLLPQGDGLNLNFVIDQRMMLFTLSLTVITGLLFGIIPSFQASNPDLIASLKSSVEIPLRRFGRIGLKNTLVVLQIGLSLMLLIGAGLFLRNVQLAAGAEVGFNPENLLVVSTDVSNAVDSPEKGIMFYDQLPERLNAIDGVQSVTLSATTPLVRWARTTFLFEGYTPLENEDMELPYNVTGTNHFSTLQIPIIQGRDFTQRDGREGARVIIINQVAAMRYFPGQDPLGKRVYLPESADESIEHEVIGVVGTAKYWNVREDPQPFLYQPFAQAAASRTSRMRVLIRTAGDPVDAIPAVRTVIKNTNRNVPILDVTTLNEVIGESLALDRMIMVISSIFGIVALVLAMVGLYGVMSYAVSRRTREIGIRMAVGARQSDVLGLILRNGMFMIVIGVSTGLVASVGVTRFIASMLHGVTTTDPLTYVTVTAVLIIVAVVACYLPAHRATKVDPLRALRYE
ncbi:MAG: ABC transporter permease [Candidatus Latescibacteria bacterium]|nr:ABC transporter permease [Candidatus Latescibacterota bacterium]